MTDEPSAKATEWNKEKELREAFLAGFVGARTRGEYHIDVDKLGPTTARTARAMFQQWNQQRG